MLKEHYAFISITTFFAILVLGATIVGFHEVTGYYVSDSLCEPMTCLQRGLEPAGRFYCDNNRCYRDCYQNGALIEMAVFCEKQ
jgi:hypothetical protein